MARVAAMEADRQLVAYDADQRRVTRTRRRLMTVAITLIAFTGFGGVVYYFYAQNRDAAMAGLVPIIRAVEGPTKVKPETPGGMDVPNRGMEVYGLIDRNPSPAPGGKVERLLPPPEQPVAVPPPAAPPPVASAPPPASPPAAVLPPIPAPSAPPPAVSAPAAAPAPPPAVAAVPPPAVAPAPAEAEAAEEQTPVVVTGKDVPPAPKARPSRPLPRAISAATPQAGEAPAAAPPSAVAAAPRPPAVARSPEPPAAERPRPAPLPSAAAASRGARVQLLAGRTEDSVRLEWARLQRENPELLGRLRAEIVRIDLDGGRGSFYRVYAMPNGDAERLCNEVRQRRVECFVVGQ
ncbi:MAG: hypothetical protein AB7K86_00055 [Rhodospirillales bacterium]